MPQLVAMCHLLAVVGAGLVLVPEVCREQPPVVSSAVTSSCLCLFQEHVVGELIPAGTVGSRRCWGLEDRKLGLPGWCSWCNM
jgi:hypothetical protein